MFDLKKFAGLLRGCVLAVMLLAGVSACAPRNSLLKSPEHDDRVSVPFFSNTSDQCGPSSLASVLNYWGEKTTPEELKAEVYLPRLRGTLPMDLLPALEKRGIKGEVIAGSFEDIKTEIQQQRPVIAYLNFGTRKHPIGHFLVVTGYDENRRGLYVHSGPAKDKFATFRRFDRGWKDTDRWMLIAKPGVGKEENINVSLHRAPQIDAPMSAEDYIQLGNIAFEGKDYRTAEKYYRKVLRQDPSHGGANNNLAMIYLSSGKNLKLAEKLAVKALSTDYKIYAEDTLAQIKLKL